MQLLHHKSVWSCTKSSKAGKQWIYNHMLINMQLCRIITDLQTSLSSELCKHILHRLPSLFEIWEYRSPRRAGVSSEIKPALCTPSVSSVFVLQHTTMVYTYVIWMMQLFEFETKHVVTHCHHTWKVQVFARFVLSFYCFNRGVWDTQIPCFEAVSRGDICKMKFFEYYTKNPVGS